MGKPFIKRQNECSTRVEDIEPGETFLHEGNIYLVTDEDTTVRLSDGCLDEWDANILVTPVQITITY